MITIFQHPYRKLWEVLKTISPTRTISIGLFDSQAKAEAYIKQLEGQTP